MTPPLPEAFLKAPIAHRALHDITAARPENSRAAVRAAIDAGYGIEIDLQLSADGQAMVFHDATLERLTARSGPVRALARAELEAIPLAGGDGEGIPALAEILELVGGRVPLLIEVKDQSGILGPDAGALEQAAAEALKGYNGPVALMSFNPHSVAACARAAPDVPRGLVTCSFQQQDWPGVAADVLDHLRAISDFGRVGASFISHEAADLARPLVQALRAAGVPVLCWTIRSPGEEAAARLTAANVTFEAYRARLAG